MSPNNNVPPIQVRFYGPNLDILQKLGNQVRSQLVQVPNVTHTSTSFGEALPKLALSLDEEQAQLTGLDNTQIAQQLNAFLEGNRGGSILEDTKELPVRVRLSNNDRANLDQITTLDLVPNKQLSPANSASLPLSALGKIDLVPESTIIARRNGQRIGTRKYQAKVLSTLPQLDSATRTLTVVLGLDKSAARKVRAGQVARLKLTETIANSRYWLPTTALVRGVRGLWSCYVLGKSENVAADPKKVFRVEQRDVEVLHTKSDRVFVRGTLQNSDQVIVNGNHRLVTGQLVRPIETVNFTNQI